MSQVMEDDILQVDGELEKLGMFHISREPEKLIEVVIGDVIDPANFRMVFKSELKEIQPMEKILSETIPGQDRSMQNLKVGRLIAVKTKDKTWFRARVLNFYKTFDEKFEIDVDLLDHGITMNGIKYPDCVGTLPSNFQQLESIAFDFKLDGLVPITGTYKKKSSTLDRVIRAKKWADVTSTVAHIAVKTYKRSLILVQSRDCRGRPKSGRLIFELDPRKLDLYINFVKFLQEGGYTNRLPIVDLNKAYVGSKFAIYVEPDSYQPKEAQANFSAMKNHEKSKSQPTPNCSFDVESNTSKAGESRLTTEFRRMKLLSDLDDLMED